MSQEKERAVLVVGTSGPVERKNKAHLEKSLGILAQAGIRVVLAGNVEENIDNFAAGTAEQRRAALEQGLGYEFVWSVSGGYAITGLRGELINMARQYQEAGVRFGGYSDNELLMYAMKSGAWMPHVGMMDTWDAQTQEWMVGVIKENKFPEVRDDTSWKVLREGEVQEVKVVPGGPSQIVDALAMGIEVLAEPCVLFMDTNGVHLSRFQRELDILLMRPEAKNVKAVVLGRTPELKRGDYKKYYAGHSKRWRAIEIFGDFAAELDVPAAVWPQFGHAKNATRFFPLAYGRKANLKLGERCSFEYCETG